MAENRHVSYPKKSSLNTARICILSIFLLGSIFLISLFFILNISPIQKLVIEESVLNHTILEIELLYQDEFKYLPEGIVAAAHKGGKDKIKYNTILSGECNTYFSSKGVLAYRKVHPRDVLWL